MTASFPKNAVWVVAATLCLLPSGCQRPGPTGAAAPTGATGPRQVVALGRLKPAGGLIEMSTIPGERLQSYGPGVEEGKTVAAGSVLAKFASYDLRNEQYLALVEKLSLARQKRAHEMLVASAQLDQANAGLAQANAKLEEIRSQEKKLAALKEAADIANEDYRLLAKLRAGDPELVSEHQLRKQENLTDQAQKDYDIAEANFPHALQAAEKAQAAAVKNVELANKNIELLEKSDETKIVEMEVAMAETTRDQAILYAPGLPGDGSQFTILKKFLQPGESISHGPVLQIANLGKMVCVAEVYEADAKEISVDRGASIESAAFRKPYFEKGLRGTVRRVGSLVSSPGLTNRNPLAPSDRSVVEVEISIDDAPAGADPADPGGEQGGSGSADDPVLGSAESPGTAQRGGTRTPTEEAAARIGLQVTVKFDPPAEETAETSASPSAGETAAR